MTVTDLKTRESFVTYERKYLPKTIQDPKKIYGYNMIALQLNSKTEEMISKLPPTDSRLRPDLNNWENANLEAAQFEMNRLVENQRIRRNKLKEQFKEEGRKVDMFDERTFYTPTYFNKIEYKNPETGKTEYRFEPKVEKYWKRRETGDWHDVPRIFEDDC